MIPVVTAPTAMVSAISTTMTMIGVEIVFACTAFIASFSVICAQLQSTSVYKDKQKPRSVSFKLCSQAFTRLFEKFTALITASLQCP
uniref:Secreted protein n=1 Tax=Syphacia muris TaxID=451379 RepID=A0A0N5AEP0_9BILA